MKHEVRIRRRTPLLSVLAALAAISLVSRLADAQTTLSDEEKLEQDFTNPLSTLPQLLIRDSYTPATYAPCTLCLVKT